MCGGMTDSTVRPTVLAVNGGSSTIKFALFGDDNTERLRGVVATALTSPPALVEQALATVASHGHRESLGCMVHRVVHGGERLVRAQYVTPELLAVLRDLIPLAPNHLPAEIALIEAFMAATPDIPHIACFDTAFHHDLPAISRTLPVPRSAGVRRYGFHGLSYAFLLSELARLDADEAMGRVVLAHLGSGASLAALTAGRCIDTSMGLTPSGGLVMSSRSGDLDPGVVTYLARQHGLSLDQIDEMLTRESGLVAISGGTADMQQLVAHEDTDERARLAVDLFCYQVRKWMGAFAAALGGLDTIVFAGGIGEHAPIVRSRICKELAFLGVRLDEDRNAVNAAVVSAAAAPVRVRIIPTNEALMMVREARDIMKDAGAHR